MQSLTLLTWHFVLFESLCDSWNALFSRNNLLYQYWDPVGLLHMMKGSSGLILSFRMFLLNRFHQLTQLPSFVHSAWWLWCILVLWCISALIHGLNPSSVHCIFPAVQPINIYMDKKVTLVNAKRKHNRQLFCIMLEWSAEKSIHKILHLKVSLGWVPKKNFNGIHLFYRWYMI